jgi:hypothetical protein
LKLPTTRHFHKVLLALCLFAGAAGAQPAAHMAAPANPEPVGATEIFDALTRPDAPSDVQRLRALKDAMAGTPDAKTLNDMRVQLDTVLRDMERRQGELPPALVMSGIASRIDSAMTRLEAAHPPAVAPAPQGPLGGPPWLLPALAALAGTLAVGLAVCLAALVAQGRSTEEADDVRETLTKIRRKLEDVASGSRKSKDVLDDEAVESLSSAAVSLNRINDTAKEAESLLRASADAAGQHLQGAVAVAGRLEIWLEELPSRLAAALGQPEDSDIGKLEAAAAHPGRAALLPAFLNTLQEACDAMHVATEALAQANLAASQATIGESAETAAFASEMINLSIGHARKLDDFVTEFSRATEGLPELGRILAEAVAQLPLQLERNGAVMAQFEAAGARAEAAWIQLGQFIDEEMPEKLGNMAEAMTNAGIAALGDAAGKCADAAQLAVGAAADVPEHLRKAAAAFVEATLPQQAALAEAARHVADISATLPETGASLAASADALKRLMARDMRREAVTRAAIGEISAAAQSARADLAATAEAVAAMPAQNDRLGALLTQGEELLAGLRARATDDAADVQRARNNALMGVEAAIAKMQMAAERLYAGAEVQEQAFARVRRAALTVATLAGAGPVLDDAATIDSEHGEAGRAETG